MKSSTGLARATIAAFAAVAIGCSTASADDSATTPIVTAPPSTTTSPPTTTPQTTPPPTATNPEPPSPTTEEPAAPDSIDPPGPTDAPPGTDPPGTDPPATTDPATTEPTQTDPGLVQPTPIPPPTTTPGVPSILNPALPALTAAFNDLIGGNIAVSVTVWRDHAPIFARAAGNGTGWQPVTPDTPMVLASVSKLVTSLSIARLADDGLIQVDGAVPWNEMNLSPDPGWGSVTVRELLDHSAGIPKAQNSWLNLPGSCAEPLAAAVANPPTGSRGKWLYSNGNYCALGLLVESVTGQDRATATQQLIFDPIGVAGPHLSTDGALVTDGPYPLGVARLDRLGGAGTWMASSDDIAAMLDSVTAEDLDTMTYPAVMVDQYGWGHTGTVDGAKACAWVLDQGRTIVVGIVAGNRPSTGGRVCDQLIPALAIDLGIWADTPHRLPA